MAEEFDYLACPNCGDSLVYSEGTHDLGCKNNPKPFEGPNKKRERKLHEECSSYGAGNNKNNGGGCSADGLDKGDGANKSDSSVQGNTERPNNVLKVCELPKGAGSTEHRSKESEQYGGQCVFGISFTESACNGTLWSIRAVHGVTNYAALMRLIQSIEERVRSNRPLAANVPNLPKKIERNKVSKLAFRYSLEVEDLYSIKYSTEILERLAVFYNLSEKEIWHIKQSDVMEE